MTNSLLHVVVSPHPDDAVLSLGACIAAWRRLGEAVIVVTIFDGPPGSPLTSSALEDRTRYKGDPVVLRQDEDRRAIAFLGASLQSVGMEELVYRYRPDGSARCQTLEDIYGPLSSDDDSVIEAVVAVLRELPLDATVHVPLATGGHSDHRIVRAAAEVAFSSMRYYDDMPYAVRLSTHDPLVIWPSVTEADVNAWIKAVKIYESQLLPLFATTPDWEQQFRAFAALKNRAMKRQV